MAHHQHPFLFFGQLNQFLAKIPNTLGGNKVQVKFQIKPVVNADSLELQLFEKLITDSVSPDVPAPFEEVSTNKSAVSLFASDTLLNDLLYQAYVNQLIQLRINSSSQPLLYGLVSLNCAPNETTCLGNVAPVLVAKYGKDAKVDASLKATKTPKVTFAPGKATFTAALAAEFFVTTANDSKKHREGGASIDLTGSFLVKVVNGTAYAKIAVDSVSVHIDHPDGKEYESKIVGTIHDVVEKGANDGFLKKGLPLRLPFRVDLHEPLINFATHTLQIQTDFVYNAKIEGGKKP